MTKSDFLGYPLQTSKLFQLALRFLSGPGEALRCKTMLSFTAQGISTPFCSHDSYVERSLYLQTTINLVSATYVGLTEYHVDNVLQSFSSNLLQVQFTSALVRCVHPHRRTVCGEGPLSKVCSLCAMHQAHRGNWQLKGFFQSSANLDASLV